MIKEYMFTLKNTLELLMQEFQLNTSKLARLTGVSQPIIYRILTGENSNPTLETIKKIANYFEISIAQLVGELPLIEKKIGQSRICCQLVPVLQRTQLKSLPDISECKVAEYVYSDKVTAEQNFAFTINDTAMEPIFPKNSLLVFELALNANDQDYVLAAMGGDVVFKQVLYDGNNLWVKSINPAFKAEKISSNDFSLLGKLVEARIYFSRQE